MNALPLLRTLLLLVCCLAAEIAVASQRIAVAYPGPYNLSYLPLDLAPKIGADKAEGFELMPRHTGGGGVALQQLQNRNVDFAVAGVPAAMSARARGNDVQVIAAINDLPLFVLMVKSELKSRVKRPSDLAGRPVGVNASSLSSKTTSQQLAELILKNDGLGLDRVRMVAAGQSWESQSAALRSGAADAILGDEPFASRLRDNGEVFFLVNLADPADSARIPGAGFLHAAVETRSDVIRDAPEKLAKVVAMIRRTLHWMATHTHEEIVNTLELNDVEARAALLKTLSRYPRLYSRDGVLSAAQVAETNRFYAATEGATHPLNLDSMLAPQWAGSKP